jgi:hypothetical protein
MQKRTARPQQKQGMQMDNEEIKQLFARVFDNELGRQVLEYLDKKYDVGTTPMTADKEYVKTCQRSVIKYIRSMLNK